MEVLVENCEGKCTLKISTDLVEERYKEIFLNFYILTNVQLRLPKIRFEFDEAELESITKVITMIPALVFQIVDVKSLKKQNEQRESFIYYDNSKYNKGWGKFGPKMSGTSTSNEDDNDDDTIIEENVSKRLDFDSTDCEENEDVQQKPKKLKMLSDEDKELHDALMDDSSQDSIKQPKHIQKSKNKITKKKFEYDVNITKDTKIKQKYIIAFLYNPKIVEFIKQIDMENRSYSGITKEWAITGNRNMKNFVKQLDKSGVSHN